MDRKTVEDAILNLERLMLTPGTKEAQYQRWFEEHDFIFDILGYGQAIPQPRLTKQGEIITYKGKKLIPDFLVQGVDGLWYIFELKRPDTPILKKSKRRPQLRSSMELYVDQCRQYSQYFDDEANRLEFKANYGLEVQKQPLALLIAGNDEGLDKRRLHEILVDRGLKVTVNTYDDIWQRLEFHRAQQFGKYENISGMSFHCNLTLFSMKGEPNQIIDFGAEEGRNRVSLYVESNGDLCCRIFDALGESYLLRHSKSELAFEYGELVHLSIEIGSGENYSVVSMRLNDTNYSQNTFDNYRIRFDLIPPQPIWVGSSPRGNVGTNIGISHIFFTARTFKFSEQMIIQELFYRDRDELIAKGQLRLRGGQYRYFDINSEENVVGKDALDSEG
jgi:hypothetical protein